MSADHDELNIRQQKFVQEYLLTGNATRSAEAAGYSKATASEQSARLLVNAKIQAKIAQGRQKLAKDAGLKLKDLTDELETIAFGSIDNLLDWTAEQVTLIPKKEMSARHKKFIDSISFERRLEGTGQYNDEGQEIKEPVVKIKMATLAKEKVKAIELLAKLTGLDKGVENETAKLEAAFAAAHEAFTKLKEK